MTVATVLEILFIMTTAPQPSKEQLTYKARPFLKWAGGKSQFLIHLLDLAPTDFGKYIEPFVGGAFFFALGNSNSILADSNEEPLITYTVVRDDFEN